eukprot:9349446-Pyramimonas_sp.AAC.1
MKRQRRRRFASEIGVGQEGEEVGEEDEENASFRFPHIHMECELALVTRHHGDARMAARVPGLLAGNSVFKRIC